MKSIFHGKHFGWFPLHSQNQNVSKRNNETYFGPDNGAIALS